VAFDGKSTTITDHEQILVKHVKELLGFLRLWLNNQ